MPTAGFGCSKSIPIKCRRIDYLAFWPWRFSARCATLTYASATDSLDHRPFDQLRNAGLQYRHLPRRLMQTEEFRTAIDARRMFSSQEQTTVMCAGAAPWRCHRSLIADALVMCGWEVRHIMSPENAAPHILASFAHVEKGMLTYPKPNDSPSLF